MVVALHAFLWRDSIYVSCSCSKEQSFSQLSEWQVLPSCFVSLCQLTQTNFNPSARRHNVLHFSGLHAKVQLSVTRVRVKSDTLATQDSSKRIRIDQV